jgi:hypothetical protein
MTSPAALTIAIALPGVIRWRASVSEMVRKVTSAPTTAFAPGVRRAIVIPNSWLVKKTYGGIFT